MTIKQRINALKIAESLEYTGFNTLVVEASGTWRSPAHTPHRPDCLVFEWRYDDEAGEHKYKLRERAGDEIHDERGKVIEVLVREEDTRKTRWEKVAAGV